MVGGQYMDVAGAAAADDDLRTLHALKTGRLIEAAVVCGARLSGAADVEPYRAFAAELGLLFQIVDDILDETGAVDELGKSVGKDRAMDKVTYVSRFGMAARGARSPTRRRAARGACSASFPATPPTSPRSRASSTIAGADGGAAARRLAARPEAGAILR